MSARTKAPAIAMHVFYQNEIPSALRRRAATHRRAAIGRSFSKRAMQSLEFPSYIEDVTIRLEEGNRQQSIFSNPTPSIAPSHQMKSTLSTSASSLSALHAAHATHHGRVDKRLQVRSHRRLHQRNLRATIHILRSIYAISVLRPLYAQKAIRLPIAQHIYRYAQIKSPSYPPKRKKRRSCERR